VAPGASPEGEARQRGGGGEKRRQPVDAERAAGQQGEPLDRQAERRPLAQREPGVAAGREAGPEAEQHAGDHDLAEGGRPEGRQREGGDPVGERAHDHRGDDACGQGDACGHRCAAAGPTRSSTKVLHSWQ